MSVLGVQFALLALTFPFPYGEQGDALFYIDHPYHLYQIALGRQLISNGQLVGFDPFFGAGYLGGATINASAKLPLLVSLLIPDSVSTLSLYLHYVFASALIAPASIAVVGLLLRWPCSQAIAATVLGLLFWWLGAFRWYHTAGMVSFVCACYLSIPYAVWISRVCLLSRERFPHLAVIAAGLLGGLGMWLHPLFGIVVSIIVLAFLAESLLRLHWNAILLNGIAIGLISIASNLPWILAIGEEGSELLDQPYQKAVGLGFLFNAMIGVWHQSMGTILNPMAIIFALAALLACTPEQRREVAIFLGGGTLCIMFASFGANVDFFARLQPNRFLAPGFLLVGLAATYAAGSATSWPADRTRHQSFRFAGPLVVFLLATVLGRELVREVLPGPHGHYGKRPPEVTPAPEIVTWLVKTIEGSTSHDGRILFETSLARRHGGGHIAGYLALQTKREFIGAPYPFLMPDRSLWDQTGFGRPLAELSDEQLVADLDLYNIGWVVTQTDQLSKRIAGLPSARLLAENAGIRFFGIDRPLSFAHDGHVRIVERDFNRLTVSTKAGTDLILRYHWIKGIATTPQSEIEPISLSPNHPPFIVVRTPPQQFTIQVSR